MFSAVQMSPPHFKIFPDVKELIRNKLLEINFEYISPPHPPPHSALSFFPVPAGYHIILTLSEAELNRCCYCAIDVLQKLKVRSKNGTLWRTSIDRWTFLSGDNHSAWSEKLLEEFLSHFRTTQTCHVPRHICA